MPAKHFDVEITVCYTVTVVAETEKGAVEAALDLWAQGDYGSHEVLDNRVVDSWPLRTGGAKA